MSTITKLPDGTYKIEETMPALNQVSIVDKSILEDTIRHLEQEKADLTASINKKKALLTEINKVI